MSVKIVIFTSSRLTKRIDKLWGEIGDTKNIIIVEKLFDDALAIARHYEANGDIDSIITGGATLELVRKNVNIPVTGFTITGFDLLKAVMNSRAYSPKSVAILSYRKAYPEMEFIEQLLNIKIKQIVYHSYDDLQSKILDLKKKGINSVVGSSVICDLAEENGMHSSLIYSREAIIQSIEKARELTISRRREAQNTERAKVILNHAFGGIIATDRKGEITIFNPAAQEITGINATFAVGKPVHELVPDLKLERVLNSGVPEVDQLKEIGKSKILINRLPIKVKGRIHGAVATFQDINAIQQEEIKVRRKLHHNGFNAKNTFNDIIGRSPNMCKAVSIAKDFALSDSTILITGETGTGKEIFAQSIHNHSNRKNKPFVAINCAALPESLLESELFGYEEGAFTGARKGGKKGLFELAHLGTIFLDEISEMPLNVQARLLRVLQEKELMRIGSSKVNIVDIRIISATNRNLWQKVQEGSFREDLFYRLNVLKLDIPPLRKRLEDISLLLKNIKSNDFVLANCLEINLPLITEKFSGLYWPGNVRQLENIVERLHVLLYGHSMEDEYELVSGLIEDAIRDVPRLDDFSEDNPSWEAAGTVPHPGNITDEKILDVLKKEGGNRTRAANKLGISRMTLWRRLKKMGL